MYHQWGKFIVWSLLNPICIIASFVITNYLGMYKTVSMNTVMLSKEFFPLYIFIGMITLVGQFLIVYLISKIISRHATLVRVFEAFLSAQRPFCAMIIIAPAFFEIEGNVMGFICVPVFLILAGVSSVFFLRNYCRKMDGFTEIKELSWSGIKGVCYSLVAMMAVSLYSIYNFGLNTHLVNNMVGWRTDIPQYSVVQAMKAIKERDPDVFLQYVDIDSFIESEADKALIKEEILTAIKQGLLLTDDGQRLKLREWVMEKNSPQRGVGTFKQVPIIDYWEFYPGDNMWRAVGNFGSEVNGDRIRVSLGFEKKNGIYKIINGADENALTTIIDKLRAYHKALEDFPYIASKDDTNSVLSIKVINVLAEIPESGALEDFSWVRRNGTSIMESADLPVKISAEVSNNTDKPYSFVELAVVYRDAQTNQALAVNYANVNVKQEPLQPQEKRQLIFRSDVNPTLQIAVNEEKAKVIEVYPSRVFYDDKQSLKLLKIKIPELRRRIVGDEVITTFD